MLRSGYPIETARLTLRPFAAEDLDDLYAMHSRPDVARFLYWDVRNRDQARETLEKKAQQAVLEDEAMA